MEFIDLSYFLCGKIGFYKTGFWLFTGVLEGLGSSGRLVETISTYPGTYQHPWSRIMAKNPPGGFFLPSTLGPSHWKATGLTQSTNKQIKTYKKDESKHIFW